MQQIKTYFLCFAMWLGAFVCLPSEAWAQIEGEPMMLIKTRVYEASEGAESITLMLGATEDGYIDVDCGYGPMESEISQAYFDSETGSLKGTQISCNVSPEGVIKIYGDADKIDVLVAPECYLTEVQLDKLTNLEILDLSNNELAQLDLTRQSKLQSINVSGNPFGAKPLLIGGNKPDLMILDMGRITGLDPSFNLSDYPNLVSFDAWANAGLKSLDPTGCPKLSKISIDSTPVETLDVTQNKELTILNISDTRIRNIDLSQNTYLTQFYADHMSGSVNPDVKLEKLDVTNNPNLVYLFASGNGFTELDVTKNTLLQDLFVNNNKLTSLDLTGKTNLLNLSVRNNNFTFATLPLPDENWLYYAYKQNEMPVARSQKVGTVIDLSDKVLREGTNTTAVLYKTNENNPSELTALGSDYYTYADGRVTLLKAVSDSVYVAFSNDAFPESAVAYYPLCTSKFMVKSEADYGQDDKVVTFYAPAASSDGTTVKFGLGIYGATEQSPKKFYVDFGKGKQEFTATSEDAPALPNASGTTYGNVSVYVPEGEQVTAFGMENVTLNSIDVTAARALHTLHLVNAGIYGSENIDLRWNSVLRSLVLTGNHFRSLNIRGANDARQKNLLHDIDLSNNELTEVTLNDRRTIHHLNLSNNKLTELPLKDADNMLTLDVSDNMLTAIDINYCTLMTSLNVANNQIASVVLPAEISLKELHCENNALDFNTLPAIAGLDIYTFAPQDDITIGKIGPGCDLSRYSLGGTTEYVWKNAGGTPLQKGIDYTGDNGVAHFCAPVIGTKVYCEMTNPGFEGLTLKTTAMEAAAMPTNVIASFVTAADQNGTISLCASEDNTPVYIDWSGTEADLVEYQVGTSPQAFSAASHAGATVRVYTYSETNNLTVFSVSGLAMSSIDASRLGNLVLFGISGAGLTSDKVKWPEAAGLRELRLGNNNFSDIDLTRYTNLYDMELNNNKFESFDASLYPNLELLSMSGNQLTSFTADNDKLWHLDLANNQLSEIDLTKLPAMNQMSLIGNQLSHIDVSNMESLKVLYLDRNKFRPSTLPLNNYALYTCANQEPIQVEVADGTVDLSAEAVINAKQTVFRWFVDVPTLDEEGNLVGEELYVDDEYFLDNGVTTFTKPIDHVMCVMTNEEFPNTYFYTDFIDVKSTGIGSVAADGSIAIKADGNSVTVNAAQDVAVRLIAANGALLRSARTLGGTCTLSNVASGAYVVLVGKTAFKVVVK